MIHSQRKSREVWTPPPVKQEELLRNAMTHSQTVYYGNQFCLSSSICLSRTRIRYRVSWESYSIVSSVCIIILLMMVVIIAAWILLHFFFLRFWSDLFVLLLWRQDLITFCILPLVLLFCFERKGTFKDKERFSRRVITASDWNRKLSITLSCPDSVLVVIFSCYFLRKKIHTLLLCSIFSLLLLTFILPFPVHFPWLLFLAIIIVFSFFYRFRFFALVCDLFQINRNLSFWIERWFVWFHLKTFL